MGMLLTGDPIDAKEAYRIGLINEVVLSNQLMKAAERWASRIIEGAPLSITASKQMALIGQDLPFDEAMDNWPSEFRKAMDCPDYIEGPLAFTQKRKPNWA
jgi:crotonobetainyl-CoA hydratase